MEGETAPRERKIRRGIVLLSSFQVALGAVIIGMSFTAFASTSSAKIRSSSPYWAGFMALFTGSVGFLTWKQLSIVSIGIYTFLSTACIVVSLVATVLTGDSAGFLKTLTHCTEVKFEHACQCCVTNITCVEPYKFQSVRDCGIVNGLLKDIMYCLCIANILCCVMSLTVTLVGCMLGAQYSRYSQNCAFGWSHPPAQPDCHDHRYNWSPYPIDPINNLPPWAPPIYYPVPNTPREAGLQCRRPPPTFFDSVDFPPPYSSREPSIAGRYTSQGSLGVEYALSRHRGISWDRLGHSVFHFYGQGTAGTVSEDSLDYVDRTHVRVLASSSGTSDGMLRDRDDEQIIFRTSENFEDETVSHAQGATSLHIREILPSSSTESDSETLHDTVFTSREACTTTTSDHHFGPSHDNTVQNQIARDCLQVRPRRHSWTSQIQATQSSNVYSAPDEIHCAQVAPNVNPWARSMSENETQRSTRNTNLPIFKQRSNSTPCYGTDHLIKISNHMREEAQGREDSEVTETSQGNNLSVSSPQENRSLFRHFNESNKSTRTRTYKKRRRPRHNPGHILQQDCSGNKETQDDCGIDGTEYRETTL